MLKKIQIEKLFRQFDYNIELKSEGITILTGPNGYGKTTVLKIIYALATKNMAFFFSLPFKKIVLSFEKHSVEINKEQPHDFSIRINSGKPQNFSQKDMARMMKDVSRYIERFPYYRPLDENHWIDRRTEEVLTTEELITRFVENNPEIKIQSYKSNIPDILDVYMIREQRLLKKAVGKRSNPHYIGEEIGNSFNNTIEEYAKELSKNLKDILANSSKIGRELESTYVNRLLKENGRVDESDFNERYNNITEKQIALSKFGLSAIKEETQTTFNKEDAKALLIFLDDTEQKLAVFNEILKKLEVFSEILNERDFAYKNLEISPDSGFTFVSKDGSPLQLKDLSSGEQHEVVLLYELLFKVNPNTLVMIDEPEISLHVAWQKKFLDDLMKIIKLKKITVITATHSPQIINGNWDKSIDLFTLTEEHKK
jgi:predicted ATP-binding protein involved in virulence